MSSAVHGLNASGVRRSIGLSAVAGVLSWAGWMGWDVFHDIDTLGNATGPYEPWQIVGSALTLLGVVIITGVVSRPATALIAYGTITVAYTIGFSVSAVVVSLLYPEGGANFWPIAAGALLLGAGLAIYAVGGIVSLLKLVASRAVRARSAR